MVLPITPTTLPKPYFKIEHTDNKGLGLFATRPIPAGTRILSESALVVIPQELLKEPLRASYIIKSILSKLPIHEQNAFRLLHRNDELLPTETALFDTFLVNCCDRNAGREAAVYKTFSRMNHACIPNCEQGFEQKTEKQVVYALRDIKPGEELTITYRNILEPSTRRLPALKLHYDFVCECETCSQPKEKIEARDKNLIQLDNLTEYYNNNKETMSVKQKLTLLRRKWEFMIEAGINTSTVAQPLWEACQVMAAAELPGRAAAFALLAHKEYLRTLGEDSIDCQELREDILDPCIDYIMHMRWNEKEGTALGMPRDMFLDWAWGKIEV